MLTIGGIVVGTACIRTAYNAAILLSPHPYNLLFPTHFINALPLLKHTFPPATLVTNLTSSHPFTNSPVLHICVTNLSPGLTGLANRAENSLIFAGSLPPRCFSSA